MPTMTHVGLLFYIWVPRSYFCGNTIRHNFPLYPPIPSYWVACLHYSIFFHQVLWACPAASVINHGPKFFIQSLSGCAVDGSRECSKLSFRPPCLPIILTGDAWSTKTFLAHFTITKLIFVSRMLAKILNIIVHSLISYNHITPALFID